MTMGIALLSKRIKRYNDPSMSKDRLLSTRSFISHLMNGSVEEYKGYSHRTSSSSVITHKKSKSSSCISRAFSSKFPVIL